MPLNIPGGYVQAEFVMTQNDTRKQAMCTVGLHTVDTSEMDTMGNSWESNIMPEVDSSYTYTAARFVTGDGLLYDISYNVPGGGAGPGMTSQVSYLIKKLTATPGRAFRGRLYLPGCDEPSVDADGRVLDAKRSALNDAFAALETDAGTLANPGLFLFHTATIIVPTVITDMICEASVATQKRRLRR